MFSLFRHDKGLRTDDQKMTEDEKSTDITYENEEELIYENEGEVIAIPDEVINGVQVLEEPSDYGEDLNLESNPVTILERKNEHASTVVVDNEGQNAEETKPLTDQPEPRDKPEPIADEVKQEDKPEPIEKDNNKKDFKKKNKLSFLKMKSPFKPRGSKPQSCTIIERYK